jgi:2,6-dihydroxypseudooxynicotine hydrolase
MANAPHNVAESRDSHISGQHHRRRLSGRLIWASPPAGAKKRRTGNATPIGPEWLLSGAFMTDAKLAAAAHWTSRFSVNGVHVSDFEDVIGAIERWDQWCAAWSKRAAVHERMGRDALAAGRRQSAADHLSRAAVTYHFAKYLFVQDMAQHRAAHASAVDCLTLALPHLDPPGERVLIPYEGKSLAATLRKPHGIARPPVIFMTMGLDSTKEELLTFQTTFLERGMAILAVDGPGQGEAEYDFPIRPDFEHVAHIVCDWIESRDDLDAGRIGMWGISLGGYYGPRACAFEKRLKACVAVCGPYDWGALWDQLPDLSRDAFTVRSHSANTAQARARASELSLAGVAEQITCPLFVVGAGLDRLTPAADAQRLVNEARGPTHFLLIEDGNHVAHNRSYAYRPQTADWMKAQLLP